MGGKLSAWMAEEGSKKGPEKSTGKADKARAYTKGKEGACVIIEVDKTEYAKSFEALLTALEPFEKAQIKLKNVLMNDYTFRVLARGIPTDFTPTHLVFPKIWTVRGVEIKICEGLADNEFAVEAEVFQ